MWDSLIWGVVVLVIMYCWHIDKQQVKDEREAWAAERKDLLDRIQAPTFAEYANKVTREKKQERPEEQIEQPDFVS